MSLPETLHAAALAAMATAVAVHPGLRDRACRPDLLASIVMLTAMADAMWLRLVPAVYAMALLLAAAMASAAARSALVSRGALPRLGACESSHGPLGFVTTAVCLPAMHGVGATAASAHHGLGVGAFTALVVLVCAGYGVASVVAAARAAGRAERGQYALMGTGAVLMALAAL
ncbi:hypothetical protein [Microbacterium hydrocarbonoxydans]|uniref:hypothetical protein n=1 Tax=Microbacterium hydrocarbonoxydans TaxID=273678 RepID=UPI0007BC3EAF|nr:hypothetical protein [Microbacterium hydrocarbonoxydans]GAT74037.1 cell wall arabinan synthesis protein [Microbacterium sp. HM58-2]